MLRTKIIATLGPASNSTDVIGRLIDAGTDVFRLNFSHGTIEQHGQTLRNIQSTCKKLEATIAIMADLCGPKIRVDPLQDGGFEISEGDSLDILAKTVVGTRRGISTSRPELVREVATGHQVLIDDGNVRLRVDAVHEDRLTCVCEAGGRISDRKGVNLPDTDLTMPALTDKDRADLTWALEHSVDYVALSFVRTARDLQVVREIMQLAGSDCRIVAKIETPQATEHIDAIIEAADAVLVARGDLGIEMDLARVPLVQKKITRLCQNAGKPVIIATQMLQSMVDSPAPTRAEVSDVANAIFDSADCVMLSAETAIGRYPEPAVRMIARVGEQTERFLATAPQRTDVRSPTMRRVTTAVAHGANLLARELNSKLVAVWTETGNTARLLSKHRLDQPVVGLSPDESVCRRMAMYYGVLPVEMKRNSSVLAMLQEIDGMLLSRNLAARGDLIIVVAGTHLDEPGATNALLIHLVGQPVIP